MKLKKQFEDFYKEIKIDTEVEDLIEKRETLENDFKNNFPSECGKHDIEIKKSDIEIFDQGSYKLHTTIKDNHGGSIDRDVAVMFPLDIDQNNDPRKIKGYGRDAINLWNRSTTIKEPCLNVSYVENGTEWMHIDLPLYAKHNGSVYLARGKEFATEGNYSWEPADPKGLNDYLLNKINGNDQLRRIIRYIKKWKLEKYYNSTLDHEVPPSIGLTLLACDCFVECTSSEGDDDLTSLQKTIQNIVNKFSLTYENGVLVKADISRYLPVTPWTDVFKKMKDSSDTYGVKFYNRLNTALQNLTDACNEESEHDAGLSVQKVLGDEFKVPAKQVNVSNSSSASSKKEHNFGRESNY